jgi:hypothetical protein
MAQFDPQVEHVARTFFEAERTDQLWDHAPETLKGEFRLYAYEAIGLFEELRTEDPSQRTECDIPLRRLVC